MTKKFFQKTIRNTCVMLIACTGIAWLYRICSTKPLVRIVVFHHIQDPVWFESMVKTLTTYFHVLTPEAFVRKEYAQDSINVLITFDDGYDSWVQHVLPILERHNVKGIFFVNSGLLDAAHVPEETERFMKKRLHLSVKPALTWEGLRMLASHGHIIGGHTRTHAHLGKVSLSKIEREISEDKRIIEERLGIMLTEFAYPFGTRVHVPRVAEGCVKQLGYHRAYTAISRFVGSGTYTIPRMCIESGMSPRVLRWWVGGAYDLFDIVKGLCVR